MPLKISVIIPVYNVYQYLADCLDSIFSQDVDNSYYEVIVVDDCSPYKEKEIINTYINKYYNIKYIKHDINKRQGGARNTGLRIADGEYIMFVDADDFIIYKNTFSILLKIVNKYNPIVLRSEIYQPFGHETSYIQLKENLKTVKELKHSISNFKEWRSGKISCNVWGTLYKKTFLLENNLFFRENVLFEDTDWVQKTLYYAEKIDFISFPYYAYRQSPNSTTRAHSIAAFEGNIDGIIETFQFYQNKINWNDDFGKELKNRFIITAINLLKESHNYPISVSKKNLQKIKDNGIASLKSKNTKDNLLIKMYYIPLLSLILIKITVIIRRWIKHASIKKDD